MPQKCISRSIKVIQSISKLIKECNYYSHKRTLLMKNKRKKKLAVKRKTDKPVHMMTDDERQLPLFA
jgi:hypothetical protein